MRITTAFRGILCTESIVPATDLVDAVEFEYITNLDITDARHGNMVRLAQDKRASNNRCDNVVVRLRAQQRQCRSDGVNYRGGTSGECPRNRRDER